MRRCFKAGCHHEAPFRTRRGCDCPPEAEGAAFVDACYKHLASAVRKASADHKHGYRTPIHVINHEET